tara:strand:- start:311 stop:601 length:291 start_codon:yes stop_codon:yes gene_type:complete
MVKKLYAYEIGVWDRWESSFTNRDEILTVVHFSKKEAFRLARRYIKSKKVPEGLSLTDSPRGEDRMSPQEAGVPNKIGIYPDKDSLRLSTLTGKPI